MKTYAAVLASVITIVAILGGVFITKVSVLSSPERYFQKGKRSYEIENYQEAINNLNEYLSIESRTRPINNIAESYFMVADSLKKLKKYTLAKERLADIINNTNFAPYSVNAVLAYADISRLENNADPYIMSKLQENLKASNSNTASRINIQYGYQLFLQKKYGEALSYFLRYDGELAVLGRARVYFNMGEYDRAFETYEDFLKYNKTSIYYDEVVRTYLIQVPAMAHKTFVETNYIKSRMYYTKIAELFPRTEHAENALFRIAQSYYNEKNYNRALDYYNRVRLNNVYTLDAEALLYIGLSYFKVGRYSDSYKALDNFISEYPANPNAARAREYMQSLHETLLAIN
ncbi:tetratricopeptide repeat protein [uncultured Brachyspira sp.]|uniref:tetratricopeptide repeat protein n=1 Tax=uncultured Brachyspira sp. TaxID=221953 RepID=UPI0025EE3DC7|nr:tetratricopeptide repeat protein [uncultured Brachyspira sp.]